VQAATDGAPPPLQLLAPQDRLTAQQLCERLAAAGAAGGSGAGGAPLVLDVRPEAQYAALALPGSVNVPFSQWERRLPEVLQLCGMSAPGVQPAANGSGAANGSREPAAGAGAAAAAGGAPVCVVCRRGNDSQRAVARLRQAGVLHAVDLVGGMQAWVREVDPSQPLL
jgi:adenylyltransferase/sulfurtransferase